MRDAFAGRWLKVYGDTFLFDGGKGRRFSTLWWRCGLWVELRVSSDSEPLTLDSLRMMETRHPLRIEGRVESTDPELARVFEICRHCKAIGSTPCRPTGPVHRPAASPAWRLR
jgi:hypothetical protein